LQSILGFEAAFAEIDPDSKVEKRRMLQSAREETLDELIC